jgi:hypothetical protein
MCQDASDTTFFDFESGANRVEIENTFRGLRFTNTNGLDWIYGDVRTATYNAGGFLEVAYNLNGNFFAWLGEQGERGRIDFAGSSATHFGALLVPLN